jgi:hypothetical protein
MTTTGRILGSALMLSVALTSGFTSAAFAGARAATVTAPITVSKLPAYPTPPKFQPQPQPQPPQQAKGIGGSSSLCYEDQIGHNGCHTPY